MDETDAQKLVAEIMGGRPGEGDPLHMHTRFDECVRIADRAIKEAVAGEREACAKVADTRFAEPWYHSAARNAAIGIADAIRARKD